jgi:hypothetical protein
MKTGSRIGLFWLGVGLALVLAGSATAQTTTYDLRSGEVIAVKGNNLIVRGPEGVKEFVISDDFRFDLDGQQLSVHQLKPGMKLTALIVTTETPVDLTVTELRNAEVIHTLGNSIVVRNSEDGQYRRFTNVQMKEMDLLIYKDGQVVPPSSLQKGDRISAVVVTKLPPAVMTQQEVTVLAQNPKAIPPNAVPVKKVTTQDLPVEPPTPPPPPKALPKTASPLPLVGLLGALALAAGFGLTLGRRFAGR